MRAIPLLTLALLLVPSVCRADDGDDTLRFYLAKSDLVVLGTIVSKPIAKSTEAGVLGYGCDFHVAEVCKGDAALEDTTIRVSIGRFEGAKKDHHPLIEMDAECILFLKNGSSGTIPRWLTADFWFGVQQPSPWMAKSLKRLASQEKPAEEP